jgi:hypothetical protein
MLSTVGPASSSSGAFLVTLYILLGAAALIGTGGLFGLWRYAKKQGVRDERMDQTADVVLGTPQTPGLNKRTDKLARETEEHGRTLKRIEAAIAANGGVGDIARNVENAVADIAARLTKAGERLAAHEAVDDHVHKETIDRLKNLEKASKS